MQTHFTAQQLQHPDIQAADGILRRCVHCGFCTATCPTYQVTGDELDGPRGRIYLIKGLLENDAVASDAVVRHLDRCLSCLACMTTCPSGVDYMHLMDLARPRIANHPARGWFVNLQRTLMARLLPRAAMLRPVFAPLRALLGRLPLPGKLAAVGGLLRTAPAGSSAPLADHYPATAPRRGTVALLAGCVQQALGQEINHATVRVLNRYGFDVDILKDACCGAIAHHLGDTDRARDQAGRNVAAWSLHAAAWQAILVNASGCGTMLKDYGHLLHMDGTSGPQAVRLAPLFQDICEFLAAQAAPAANATGPNAVTVICHTPCSLRHGQRVIDASRVLLQRAGLRVITAPNDGTCCGSAGTYNVLQPDLAATLGRNKAAALDRVRGDVVATGNLGCLLQMARFSTLPMVHNIQLLDWAGGGPLPPALEKAQVLAQRSG